MKIILVRHGETEWNRIGRFQGRTDNPLNENGKTQARALARSLRGEPLTAIYSSPLRRAVETAEIVRAFHPGISLIKTPDLIEMDLGVYEGMHVTEWAVQNPKVRRLWQKIPSAVQMPGGESLKEVRQRAVGALSRITGNHTGGSTLLLCSHNFVIVSMLCYVCRISLDRFREIKQDTGSCSIIRKNGDLFKVVRLNVRSH
jgi:probable phosphoglycerate mutase